MLLGQAGGQGVPGGAGVSGAEDAEAAADRLVDTALEAFRAAQDGAARWFLYHPERKGLLTVGLVGVVAPSTDKGGLRAFPFSLYVEVGRLDLRQALFRHVRGLESTWRRLDDMRADMQGANSLRDALVRVE